MLLFLACDTQWRVDATGRATGLLYNEVEVTARMMGIAMNKMLFVRVREMERAGLKSIADIVARRERRR